MADLLKQGDLVSSGTKSYEVIKEIGEGGQGKVYLVKSDSEKYALKWYNLSMSTAEQYEAIQILLEKGSPSEKFIWPLEICEGESEHNFGYIMPLIDLRRYTKLTNYFSGDTEVKRLEIIIDICMRIANAFYELHLNGLCYRDISFGNIFVNFDSGDVLICDNDNVTIDNLKNVEDIWGTSGFVASELVRGESPPSTETDLYSLSVVLFRMLNLQHPLQGRREFEVEITSYESELELYGNNPIFIYDPIDASNRPVEGHKDIANFYWPYYPLEIKELFTEAFTIGLAEPYKRIRESVWIKALGRLRSQIGYCYSCDSQLFIDKSIDMICPKCNKEIKILPFRMKIDNNIILLNHDTVLFKNQIYTDEIMKYDEAYARVEIHPEHNQVWGLRNQSDDLWEYTTAKNVVKNVSKNGIIPLKSGQKINFGNKTGLIR